MKRHGNKHDIYANPHNGKQTPVPRHNEIKESLVKLILKQLGIDDNH
ncbi:type II toxin-antitoxin system HicA family toxin [Desulfonatronovibrio magnus]